MAVIIKAKRLQRGPAFVFRTRRIVDIIVDNIRTGVVKFAGRQESSPGVIVVHREGGLPSPTDAF